MEPPRLRLAMAPAAAPRHAARDRRATAAWLPQLRKISKTPPLSRMLETELVPGGGVQSDSQLLDGIRCGPRQFRSLGRMGCDRTELPVNHLAGT